MTSKVSAVWFSHYMYVYYVCIIESAGGKYILGKPINFAFAL